MSTAKKGNTVKVFYTGTLEDGTEFDSNIGGTPLEFVLGEGQLIPGFEKAVTGKKVGDKVTTTIAPADAYGEYNEEETITIPRNEVPENIDPEVGMVLQLNMEGGVPLDVMITEVTDEHVVLDANHPLAGKTLIFNIEIAEIL
ncbi:FKBP-type peptidyl-prolyl cis-trans isomerase [Desulfovibrio litoralis]|uniref:Peptidyl-prolyl cis-trans isomerase n=1 Tax=Desulfovibrio litoralis DSM 11393 TaxID=1121455 RepID=A0A1M7SR93_9BACT|nr:peptidylprolyl isomerase [Desulfovibrio litoralis]SHN60916.1 peptidylprolyl isomerase [Desulfovibrio litoralis DSM 11393]